MAPLLPPVATKLTQSPWFLNDGLLKATQPLFMHWSLLVGAATSDGEAVIFMDTVPLGAQPVSWRKMPTPAVPPSASKPAKDVFQKTLFALSSRPTVGILDFSTLTFSECYGPAKPSVGVP